MKEICPSLQYIRVHNWSWECIPLRKLESSELDWALRELEFEESLCMEIMSFERFSDEAAGLPSRERPFYDKDLDSYVPD